MPCEMYPYSKILSFTVSLPVNSSQSLSYRKQQQILLSAAEGNLPGRTEDNIVLRQKQQPVPVSRSPFCFEEKPKPLLCQTPSRWLFIATTQRLQSCQEGVSPRPDTCFSQLSQFVCDHFKNLSFLVFQLFSLWVATSVLSSCCLFSTAVPIPICWQQPSGFTCVQGHHLHLYGCNTIKTPSKYVKNEMVAQGLMGWGFFSSCAREKIMGFSLYSSLKGVLRASLFF